MSPVWILDERDAPAEREFDQDASAQRVRDVVVPEREVALQGGQRRAGGKGS